MVTRRDWILELMGITQWQLRHPSLLQGDVSVAVGPHIRLVIVAEQPPALSVRLCQDVLSTLQVTAEQVCCIRPEQVAFLRIAQPCWFWLMGCEAEIPDGCRALHSPVLARFGPDAQAKRQLWQQIVTYEQL
ncbi:MULTISPECIES: DNA polymerase III subunit psi [Plesiomonas]|uniref:DNA polymerase III subunit psi n=1 Tax=Plesiomonas TaxID=702 RepID=UPI0007ECA8EC|nr:MULTISPECIES: DNA polymerase III subunit psi [Plesiomonas]MCE5164588.1 DNA polymerase III subunit psi [Plesiomonas sp. PI-19]MCQ8857428.1 DNA polymerase III subunit psi [Plesiomonas shigelloides]